MNYFQIFCFLMLVSWLGACQPGNEQQSEANDKITDPQDTRTEEIETMKNNMTTDFDTLAQKLANEGLVRLTEVDSSLIIDLRYSTTNNFTGMDVYGPFEEAFMQPEPAQMLARANKYLKESHPEHTFYIYDAVRPRSVQRILWDTLDMPLEEKSNYVANPDIGSIHNFGAAVDLTIADAQGQPVDMGTDFDYFGELAYPIHEERMLEEGRLTQEQVANRQLLREVMTRAGFTTIDTEWWHFNAMSRDEAAAKYGIVE